MAEIKIIDKCEDLSAYENQWNTLAVQCGQDWPMLTYAWVVSYLENMIEADEKWYCLIAADSTGLSGVMPIIINPHGKMRMPLYSDILIRKGSEKEILPGIFDALKNSGIHWNGLSVYNIRDNSAMCTLGSISKSPLKSIRDFDGYGSFNPVKGNFENFHAALSHNHRRNLTKAENKFAKLKNPCFLFLDEQKADPKYLETFIELEASGYKSINRDGGSAIKTSPKRVAFKKALIKRFFDMNCLEWHILEADDKAVAMQMVFKIGQTLTLYKICYDEEYGAIAPGKLLALKMFERAYSSGQINGIHWITDLPFHDLWNAEKKTYYVYHIYPPGPGTYLREYIPRRVWMPLRDSRIFGGFMRKARDLARGKRK